MAKVSEHTCGIFSFSFLFKFLFEKALFGRSLAQLILAALSLYPFEIKEGQKRRFLSDVPFGPFCLAMYPSADFAASGASWPFCVVWGWILACWDLRGWNMPSGLDLGPPKLASWLRWPPALKSELLLFPWALCVLLYVQADVFIFCPPRKPIHFVWFKVFLN